MSKILIIEDDEHIRNMLDRLLQQNGYQTSQAESIEQAENFENSGEKFDVYLIDVILPDGNGFDLCKRIRTASAAIIIFITSCDDEESITRGLDIGGDDYITKPFRAAELLSRIQANLRRIGNDKSRGEAGTKDTQIDGISLNQGYIKLGEIKVDIDRHEVLKSEKAINLTPLEYELLILLMINHGLIVKREVILEKLWDSNRNFVEDSTLTVAVSRLKSKLGTTCEGRSFIETIRGYGYRWND